MDLANRCGVYLYPSIRTHMKNRSGFTMIEVLVVAGVAATLLSIVNSGMNGYQTRTTVREARDTFLSLHAETRAKAVALDQNVLLHVDRDGDSAWIGQGDAKLSPVSFRDLGVDLEGSGVATICMTPRGFADAGCNSFGTGTLELRFVQGPWSSSVSVLPLGQAIY